MATTTPANWRDYVDRLMPPWLSAHYGIRFAQGAIGLMGDIIAEGARQAVKAHLLLADTSPADALPYIGEERGMPRYEADTDATYRDRLHDAWNAWGHGGNNTAVLGQLAAYGVTGATIETVLHDAYPFEAPLDTAQWSRFAVLMPGSGNGFARWTYGSGVLYGTGWTYGSTMTVAQLLGLFALIDKWKSGHETCPLIKLDWGGGQSTEVKHP